jgi:protein SCO1/2
MQKYIKAGMLTLVLALPALIVLFLHGFAENHFQLPYFVPLTDSSGRIVMNGQDTLFYQVPTTNKKSIRVVSFIGDDAPNQLKQQFLRVEKLASEKIIVEKIAGQNAEIEAIQKYRVPLLKKAKSSQTIPYYEQFVLIDKKGYIRGFYEGTNPEEVDRLITEIKILLDIDKKEDE